MPTFLKIHQILRDEFQIILSDVYINENDANIDQQSVIINIENIKNLEQQRLARKFIMSFIWISLNPRK